MFRFAKVAEVVTGFGAAAGGGEEDQVSRDAKKGRRFVEITLDTPLRALSRFFEWNSAAIVTEREEEDDRGAKKQTEGLGEGKKVSGSSAMKPVAVVTKVDLLTWLMRQSKLVDKS